MSVQIRIAARNDLWRLIELLSQLSLEDQREDLSKPAPVAYASALDVIDADPRQTLLVAEVGDVIVGMALLTRIPNLSHFGRPYAMVEDVVVDAAHRGKGHGEALMRHAVDLARDAGCYKLVLTSNKARADAHRFYRRIGFDATHEGFRIDF